MKLTLFTDYALRVLLYAEAQSDRLVTIEETADAYSISRAHLMKVVSALTRAGYLRTVRGRTGGFTLAQPAAAINLGAVMRDTERDFQLVECFGPCNRCAISNLCVLPNVLNEALRAFLSVLDRYTLADIAVEGLAFDGATEAPQPPRGPELQTSDAP